MLLGRPHEDGELINGRGPSGWGEVPLAVLRFYCSVKLKSPNLLVWSSENEGDDRNGSGYAWWHPTDWFVRLKLIQLLG